MSPAAEEVEELFLSFLGDDPTPPKQIRAQMNKQISKNPTSGKAWAARAWANYELEDYDAAIADATRAIQLCPDSYLPWHVRGSCHWRTDNPQQAEPDLTEAIRLADGVQLFLEETYRYRGGLRCNDNRLPEAIDDLNQCLKIHPDDSWGYVFRGNALCRQEKYSQAIKDLERAILIDEDDEYPAATLAWLLATCPEKKIRDGKRAVKLAQLANELSDNAYLPELAAAYAEFGDFNNAMKTQRRAIKQCADSEQATVLNERLAMFESGQALVDRWDD